jgi:GntR family transcriptional repressor for pyruvate dehydrogenase complex
LTWECADLKDDNSLDIAQRPRESAVEYVIGTIKDFLLTKRLKPGDRLPSEFELAEKLNVSRGSVRMAMRVLREFGILDIRQGDGTYIADKAGKASFDPLLFQLILTNPIEMGVVRLIVDNATDEDLRTLRLAHESLGECGDDHECLRSADLKFHAVMAEITGNELMEKIYNFTMEYFAPYVTGKGAYGLHQQIVEALEARDVSKAYEAVAESVEVWRDEYSF